jgi:hypothetical protein
MGVQYLKKNQFFVDTIIRVASLFPCFLDQEKNQHLTFEVIKKELEGVLHSFAKDKSLRLDELPVEYFLGCFDFIWDDLLKIVEYSKIAKQILAPFNSTFISLIPKSNNPCSFEQLRPISLCNAIYKIISKIISLHLNDTLFNHIS